MHTLEVDAMIPDWGSALDGAGYASYTVTEPSKAASSLRKRLR